MPTLFYVYNVLAMIFGSFTIGYVCVHTTRAEHPALRVFGYAMLALSAAFIIMCSVNVAVHG